LIRVKGQEFTLPELARKVAGMSPRGVLRNSWELALAPKRRLQVRWLPAVSSPARLARRLGFPSLPAMESYFHGEAFDLWPTNPGSAKQLAEAIAEHFPAAREDAVERGEAAIRHEFSLLGSGPVRLGDEIDWLCDFKTGKRWVRQFYADIDYMNRGEPSDVKVPWELSRSHHLVDLARAFLLTNDRRYVREASAQLESWLDSNPFGCSVNWCCTMDVAIRAVNWIWCLSIVGPFLEEGVLAPVVASLYQHGVFIRANLERGDVNGNHYISDAVGLVALGCLFRRWRLGREWLARGSRILVEEIAEQVYPDGVDHEMSVPYHRLVAEIFLTGFLLMRQAGQEPPASCWERLRKMGQFAIAYTRPDGSVPVWGDADDGRLQRFGHSPVNDHRHLLSTMAILFNDGDLRPGRDYAHEDTLWLLGPSALDGSHELLPISTPPPVWHFPHGGFAVLRAPEAHLFFDAGPVGLRGRGGHGHNDALSFELWWHGAPLIVDPGSHVYTADPPSRNRFRSTAAHNSPMLGEHEMAELGDDRNLWSIADHAQAVMDEVGVDGPIRYAAGHHVGYTRIVKGAIVRRRIELDEETCQVVDDVPATPGWHVNFTLHPSARVSNVSSPERAVIARGDHDFVLTVVGADRIEAVPSLVSPSYGVVERAEGLRMTFGGGRLVTTVTSEANRASQP
jgi:hypothetical protein